MHDLNNGGDVTEVKITYLSARKKSRILTLSILVYNKHIAWNGLCLICNSGKSEDLRGLNAFALYKKGVFTVSLDPLYTVKLLGGIMRLPTIKKEL